ncbi:MAG: arylesterase [Mariprofundaceae bacterium]|nr:arylesterase [Mariprofundaceae bacterium]
MKRSCACPPSVLRIFFLLGLLLAACSSQPQLPKLAPDAAILAFGDSLTYGSGAGRDESYPAVLSRLTGLQVINAGVPGEVTSQGVKRLPGVLDESFPALLILCHGGNDLLRKQDVNLTAQNLRSMIRMAHKRGVPVLLLAVPKPGVFMQPPDFYEEIATEMKVPIALEIVPDILSKRSLKSDTIHPNRDGYRIMAEEIFQLMKDVEAL